MGVLLTGGLNTVLACFMNGSSLAPRSSIFIPKAQRAMTSIVKALNWLLYSMSHYSLSLVLNIFFNSKLHFRIDFPLIFGNITEFDGQSLSALFNHHRHLNINSFLHSETNIKLLNYDTLLILPVVKAGVTEDRMSFQG